MYTAYQKMNGGDGLRASSYLNVSRDLLTMLKSPVDFIMLNALLAR